MLSFQHELQQSTLFYKYSIFFRVSLSRLMIFLILALYYAYNMLKVIEAVVTVII